MKTLTKYLRKRKATIDFILRKPSENYQPNTFHKLRVEIKKLNSIFDLILFWSINFKQKATSKPFKLIFRQAGKVRDLQIEDKMIQKYFKKKYIKDYRKSLKIIRLKTKKDFFILVNKNVKRQLNKRYREIIPYLYGINHQKMNIYLEQKRNKIQELLGQESIQREQIHKLRKQLKILNYNRAIINKETSDGKLTKQKGLSKLLGKWHDCQVIIKHLKKTLNAGQLSSREFEQIKVILPKIIIESNILFNKIKIIIPESEFFPDKN